MQSKYCIKSYKNHPSLMFEADRMLFHMINNEFLFFDGAKNTLESVDVVHVGYQNLGDPFREFCYIYYRLSGSAAYMDISEEDGKYLYSQGYLCTGEVIEHYKWAENKGES